MERITSTVSPRKMSYKRNINNKNLIICINRYNLSNERFYTIYCKVRYTQTLVNYRHYIYIYTKIV